MTDTIDVPKGPSRKIVLIGDTFADGVVFCELLFRRILPQGSKVRAHKTIGEYVFEAAGEQISLLVVSKDRIETIERVEPPFEVVVLRGAS